MHAVILTFPGHFFQTLLSIKTLIDFYPEVNAVSFVLDDINKSPWNNYPDNFEKSLNDLIDIKCKIYQTSKIDQFDKCVSGWWRQQLVKLSLDKILDGEQWFVVDGDTIFATRCEIENVVPITRRSDHESNFSKMSVNYVSTLLGTTQGCLLDDGVQICTNAIPFRLMDRSLLEMLRRHVESKFNKEFIQLHLDWFNDQTIVADFNPPIKMVMSEWELIECYRRYVLGINWPFVEIGSGYGTDVDLTRVDTKNLFRHSYKRDTEIGKSWFQQQGLKINDDIWQRQSEWYLQKQR